MNGKGDKRRPTKVDAETFDDNWQRIFGAKVPMECPYCGEIDLIDNECRACGKECNFEP